MTQDDVLTPGSFSALEARRPGAGVRRYRLFAGIFLVYLFYALPSLFDERGPLIALGLVLIAVFVALYLVALPLGIFGRSGAARRWTPVAMAAVMGLYLATVDGGGVIFTTYVCIALVMLRSRRVSAPLILALCGAVVVLPQYVAQWGVSGLQWAIGGPALLTSLVMYGVKANAANQVELLHTRAEVERLSAEQERLRIARDLHDLLGHALTAVVVKADLAARLTGRLSGPDAERAADEMREVAQLARQGLADVRATVAGYRGISLVTELASAREVLRASGIGAELPPAVEDVDGELRELFGWVVREGVTNVVRHSRAAHVQLDVGSRWVELRDDGRGAAGDGVCQGSGLAGLRERVAAAGGTICAGPRDGGGWRLRVEVPVGATGATG